MKKILVFVLLMVAMFGYGQDVPSPYKFTSIVDLYEFPTVGATGNLDVQLPLYTVNTKGFELPLSLSYDQMGNTNVFYMGNQFGDAWVLNVAGTISRKCVDRPTPTYSSGVAGLWCNGAFRQAYSYESYKNKSLINDEYYYNFLHTTHTSREKPDIYTFSFPGLTGKFIINKEGNQFVGKLIESSDFATIVIDSSFGEYGNFSNITITDKKGYKYRFSAPSNINYNRTHNSHYSVSDITVNPDDCITNAETYQALVLSNGNSGFTTLSGGGLISSQVVEGTSKFWENMELTEIYDKDNNLLIKYEYENISITGSDPISNWIRGIEMRQSYNKLYLKKIDVIGQGTIVFNNIISGFNNKSLVNSYTNSIEVKDLKNNLIKKITLGYIKKAVHNLTYVKDYKDGSYGLSFEKRLMTEIREYDNTEQDYLLTGIAYKNRAITKDDTFVDRYGFLTDVGYCPQHLSASSYKADTHILQKIKYPTRGSVVYQFEPHTFSRSLYIENFKDYNYDNHNYQTVALNKSGNTASFTANEGDTIYVQNTISNSTLRLFKKAGTIDELVHSGFKSEEYRTPFTDHHCKHLLTRVILPGSTNNQYILKYATSSASTSALKVYRFNYSNNYQDFGYAEGSRIAKIAYFTSNVNGTILDTPTGENNAEKVITFSYDDDSQVNMSSGRVRSNYRTQHEMKPLNILYDQVTTQIRGVGKQFAKYGIPDISIWNDSRRTDVKKQKLYDSSGQMLSESDYNYVYYPGIQGSFVKENNVVSKNYEGTNFMTSSSFTEYDTEHLQPIVTETTDALGKTTKSEFDYTTINNTVVNTHVRNYINGSLTEQSQNSYDTAGNPVKTEFKTPNMSAYEVVGAVNKYDTHGNLIHSITPDGTSTCFIWGYNKTQLVAKLVNISYADFLANPNVQNNIIHINTYSNQAGSNYDEAVLKMYLDGLKFAAPNAMVTTFTYKPMVGISSITDENGKTTTYEYDAFNRLRTIKDQLGNILKEYQYNFTN